MASFKGAARRQELIFKNEKLSVYRDFAHAPSKVKATVRGFKEQFGDQKLIAFLELHTFSSLNKDFIPQYKGSMDAASKAVVYYNPEVVKHKKLPFIDKEDIKNSFGNDKLIAMDDAYELQKFLYEETDKECIVLLMTSGSFSGLDLQKLAKRIVAY